MDAPEGQAGSLEAENGERGCQGRCDGTGWHVYFAGCAVLARLFFFFFFHNMARLGLLLLQPVRNHGNA
jgi:hypothetical protein